MSKRRHNFGTKRFKEKSLFIFHARIALKSLILLFVRLIVRGARIRKTHRQTDSQTDRTSTVTLAHARRGLMTIDCTPRISKLLIHITHSSLPCCLYIYYKTNQYHFPFTFIISIFANYTTYMENHIFDTHHCTTVISYKVVHGGMVIEATTDPM